MSLKPKVALSQDLLISLARLSPPVQAKVLKWAIRFQSDPTSTGIHYEKIQGARDANLKSVRIDQDWRGIVFQPIAGDVYVLLYVDRHDDAYQWAAKRRIAVNPVTGAMQIVITEEIPGEIPGEIAPQPALAPKPKPVPALAPGLFAALSDHDLLALGTPEDLLPRVRAITTEDDLDTMQPQLPVEAYEGLFLCAAGDTVSQVLAARETRVDREIDTNDFAASLERAESQARFVVVEDDDALTAIMNAPLAQWRVFLHPTQKRLATADLSGPARILGGAGTGKTVLAMHRAKWLAEHHCPPGSKVLFTTFTRNLAADVEQNLKTFCSPAVLERIEVRNLDAWVHAYLRGQKYEHRITYDRQKDAKDAWQLALALKDASLGLPEDFYQTELEQVILAQGIATRDAYRAARRAGRRITLNRGKRDAIWPVFEEYRQQLTMRKLKEVDDAYRDAAALLARGKGLPSYAAILVDETQDFGPQALRLLRAMIPPGRNDLFFVGDGHQRIYGRNKATLSRCGIDIRGRSRKLYVNYRTTDEIRRHALAYLEGCEIDDLDEGTDEHQRYKSLSHGPAPFIETLNSLEDAEPCLTRHLAAWRQDDTDPGLATCVIAPSRAWRDRLKTVCEAEGWKTGVIEANEAAGTRPDTLWFSTMHRAKGLEFDRVIALTRLNPADDPEESADQRRLLYVAITRAKREAGVIFLT